VLTSTVVIACLIHDQVPAGFEVDPPRQGFLNLVLDAVQVVERTLST
jgi:hypothetical protein